MMLFAALSGSSPATVVAIGTIVIAGMRQVGYSKEFAAGVIANAGTLGILIPPSIVMVVYASATDVSVGRMFLAGVIPGLLAGTMLMVTIYVIAKMRGLPKGDWLGWTEVFASAREAILGAFSNSYYSWRYLWGNFHTNRSRCSCIRLCIYYCSFRLPRYGTTCGKGRQTTAKLNTKPSSINNSFFP